MSFANTFKALSSPVRREILSLLKDNTIMSAGEISEQFETTNATISHHLSQLKKAELIRENKQKNSIYYELNTSVFEELMIWFSGFQQDNNDISGGDYNDKKK